MRGQCFFVYLLASGTNGGLRTGMTHDLAQMMAGLHDETGGSGDGGATPTADIPRLVWFEVHDEAEAARLRERRIAGWDRAWKIALIEDMNPAWRDLGDEAGGR
jgi:putative endonuclease